MKSDLCLEDHVDLVEGPEQSEAPTTTTAVIIPESDEPEPAVPMAEEIEPAGAAPAQILEIEPFPCDAEANLEQILFRFESGTPLRGIIDALGLYPDATLFGLVCWTGLNDNPELRFAAWDGLCAYLYGTLRNCGYTRSLSKFTPHLKEYAGGYWEAQQLILNFLHANIPLYQTEEAILPFFTSRPPVAVAEAIICDAQNRFEQIETAWRNRKKDGRYIFEAELDRPGDMRATDRKTGKRFNQLNRLHDDRETYNGPPDDPESYQILNSKGQPDYERIALRQLIGRLKPEERWLIGLHIGGLHDKEIGEQMGTSENAIQKRRVKIIEKLRRIYQGSPDVREGSEGKGQ